MPAQPAFAKLLSDPAPRWQAVLRSAALEIGFDFLRLSQVEGGGRMHPNVMTVAKVLADGGAQGQVRELANAVRTAADAAAALGCPTAAIANSLVFMADEQPVLILTSGGHRVDTGHVATLLGARKLRRATPDQVRAATGQPIGGVAPVGHPRPVRTLVDVTLQDFEVVWAAGGIPHAVFPTSFDELLRITGGEPVLVTPDG